MNKSNGISCLVTQRNYRGKSIFILFDEMQALPDIMHILSLRVMVQRKKPDVDIILDVLKACLSAYPDSAFIQSLHRQYLERGGLSKKQLQGLHSKASRLESIPASRLATLEAQILKMPNRYKSETPAHTPLYEKDERIGRLIEEILSRYPQHKRVLFFRTRYDNNESLSPSEISELEKFHKLLVK